MLHTFFSLEKGKTYVHIMLFIVVKGITLVHIVLFIVEKHITLEQIVHSNAVEGVMLTHCMVYRYKTVHYETVR